MGVVIGAMVVAMVLAIAAVVIGREASRLSAQAPRLVFDVEEAVDWVAEHLPLDVAARLSYDDVRAIVDWSLEHFRSMGVPQNGDSPEAAPHVVVRDADTIAYVLAQAEVHGLDVDRAEVDAVLEAEFAYFEMIGAAGPAPDEEDGPGNAGASWN